MNKKCGCLFLLFLLLLFTTQISSAKERYTFIPDRGYVVEGENLPKYLCVESFYGHALLRFKISDESYARFLGEIGIKPNTDAARAIEKAMFSAQVHTLEIVDAQKPYLNEPDDEWDQMQTETLKNQVLGLKEIYNKMLKELKAAGISKEAIETYLDKKTRPKIGMSSSNAPIKELAMMDLFETQDPNQQ